MTGAGSIVLAGGGTAGHTSPLVATAYELLDQQPDLRVTAVGTARGLETTVIPAAGLPLELIPPVPMPRRPGVDLALVGPRLVQAVRESVAVLAGSAPRPSWASAATSPLRPTWPPGGWACRSCCTSRTSSRDWPTGWPPVSPTTSSPPSRPPRWPHATCIGLPMRRSITELDRAALRGPARATYGLPDQGDALLVSGGSQGAASINRAVRGGAPGLLAAGISVLHVLGAKNITSDDVRVVDPDTGAVYAPVAYVEQMEQAYAVADLMLGRCGAGTVMETAAVGLPAVFVPYPHGNGEQARNAALVVEAGGGLLLADADCTSEWVASEIPHCSPTRNVGRNGDALAGVARTDAAAVLAKGTLEVIG